jgi:hypothetical protein
MKTAGTASWRYFSNVFAIVSSIAVPRVFNILQPTNKKAECSDFFIISHFGFIFSWRLE